MKACLFWIIKKLGTHTNKQNIISLLKHIHTYHTEHF